MKKRWLVFMLICVIICQLSGCGNNQPTVQDTSFSNSTEENEMFVSDEQGEQTEVNNDVEYDEEKESSDKSVRPEKLTLEQKVGQLFIVRPDGLNTELSVEEAEDPNAAGVTKVDKMVTEALKKYNVGGVCLFSKNITDPKQLKSFTSDLQDASDIPMFITVDEEGGIVARLANNNSFNLPKYKSAAAVASSGNTRDAKEMGETIGGYLKEYGFNMDFAPDADVNTNPNNPVIGTRAFSSDANIAADMVAAAAEGLRSNGILPTLKHFPGHGDTAEDSHSLLAVTNKTLKDLQECELLPFASDSGKHCVMVGHIATPKITGTNIPATLSEEIIDMIPNKENTLVITDSLSMKAITNTYSSGEAAVLAFEAGCDMLLMPADFAEAYEAVLQAVKSGRISEKRLNESVDKIFDYKQSFVY